MFVIAAGNPFREFKLYGPFDNEDEAIDWTENNELCSPFEWYLVEVLSPDT